MSMQLPVIRNLSQRQREALQGYMYIAPWFIGFLIFTAGPLIASLGLSFTRWGFVDTPRFVGFANYEKLWNDPVFWIALRVTVTYTAMAVPLIITIGLCTALLMTRNVRGVHVFRTIYYLPAVVGGVPMALLWTWVFNPDYGILNHMISTVGLPGPNWLGSPQWAPLAIVIVSVWNFGLPMVVFIAGLQNIPPVLYEAASLDGATALRRLWHVTLPMLSPTIFFLLVHQIIVAFQVFDVVFVLTGGSGGPLRSTLLYLLYFYQNAFQRFEMGYASALVWVLFIIIMGFTVLIFKSSSLWVYYESEVRND
jgi:multiple sugar transport system permease protein